MLPALEFALLVLPRLLLDVVHGSPVERRQRGKVETYSDLLSRSSW
jgi:hypothetical protein